MAATIFNEAALLERSGDNGHCSASRAQHHCEELLSKVKVVRLDAVLGHQQPTSKPFFGTMQAMAACNLAKAEGLLLHEFEDSVAYPPQEDRKRLSAIRTAESSNGVDPSN